MAAVPNEATRSEFNKRHAWRRPLLWFGMGVLVGVGLMHGLLFLLMRISYRDETRLASPTDTESGYPFPAVADISDQCRM